MLVLSLPQELATLLFWSEGSSSQEVDPLGSSESGPLINSSSRPNPWHCKKDAEVEATMLKCCFLQLLGKFFPKWVLPRWLAGLEWWQGQWDGSWLHFALALSGDTPLEQTQSSASTASCCPSSQPRKANTHLNTSWRQNDQKSEVTFRGSWDNTGFNKQSGFFQTQVLFSTLQSLHSHLPLLPLATTLPWNWHIFLPSPGICLPLFSHRQAWQALLSAQLCLPPFSVPSSRFSSPPFFKIVSLDQSSVPKHFPPPSPLCALSVNRT